MNTAGTLIYYIFSLKFLHSSIIRNYYCIKVNMSHENTDSFYTSVCDSYGISENIQGIF